jgi:hypothetical protein
MRRALSLPGRLVITVGLGVLATSWAEAQQVAARPRSDTYRRLQRDLARGWNTWNTESMLSHVLLPNGLAVTLGLHAGRYTDRFFPSTRDGETVKPGPRTEDGSYTSVDVVWAGNEFRVESGHDGDDLVLLVTARTVSRASTVGNPNLIIEAGMLWNRPGCVERQPDRLAARVGARLVTIQTTAPLVRDASVPVAAATMAVKLAGEVGVSTGRARSLEEIRQVLGRRRGEMERRAQAYGELADVFTAMRTVLAWNVVYDPEGERVIVPVSRSWNSAWGGFVLFDWDSYFAAAMLSFFNPNLAVANAVEVTKGITPHGFIPNWRGPMDQASYDRSQPPVGSLMVREVYRRYPERWFLAEVYDELLTWNRWWPQHRGNHEWLSWGSNDIPPDGAAHTAQGAMFESGLDNSPMFDGVPFNGETSVLELADVGLTSMYVADCDALAEISAILGKQAEERELRDRGDVYRRAVAKLWSEKAGLFLNLQTNTMVPSERMSPTNFYPLLARAVTPAQAERMVREHYFNVAEFDGDYVMPSISRNDPAFKDNDYWRGRIWAPMNFLVYLGMRNYSLDEARGDLVRKSRALLRKTWREQAAVYENLNSVTGRGDDVRNADPFYTWGALLGYLSFLEHQPVR